MRKKEIENERVREKRGEIPIFREIEGLKRHQRTDYNKNEILRF